MKSFLASLSIMLLLALSPVVNADVENPFGMSKLSADQTQLADNHNKCGEGKCGGSKKEEAKCGEGKCGDSMKKEAKCDSGKDENKDKKMKCGTGKCGSN